MVCSRIGGFTWRRQSSSVDIDEDTLDDRMRERLASGAQSLRDDAFVKACVFALLVRVNASTLCIIIVCARATGHRSAFGRQSIPVCASLWHGKCQIRGDFHPAATGVQRSTAFVAVLLPEKLTLRVLELGYDDQEKVVFFQFVPGTASFQAGDSFIGRQIHPSLRIDHTQGHPGKQRVVEGPVFFARACVCVRVFFIASICTCDAEVQGRELASICDDAEQGLHPRARDAPLSARRGALSCLFTSLCVLKS